MLGSPYGRAVTALALTERALSAPYGGTSPKGRGKMIVYLICLLRLKRYRNRKKPGGSETAGNSCYRSSFRSFSLIQPRLRSTWQKPQLRTAGRTKQMRISPSQSMGVMAALTPWAISLTQPV